MTTKKKEEGGDETITLTRSQYEEALKQHASRATEDDGTKRLRQIAREEGEAGALAALEKFFADLGDDDGGGGSGGGNDGGGSVSAWDAMKELIGWKE